MYLLAICVYPLEKHLFIFFVHFFELLVGYFCYALYEFFILDINSYQIHGLHIFFPHSGIGKPTLSLSNQAIRIGATYSPCTPAGPMGLCLSE